MHDPVVVDIHVFCLPAARNSSEIYLKTEVGWETRKRSDHVMQQRRRRRRRRREHSGRMGERE